MFRLISLHKANNQNQHNNRIKHQQVSAEQKKSYKNKRKIRIIFNNNNNKALEIERKGNKIKQNINRRTVVNSVCKSIAFVYIYLSFQTISNTGK